MKTPYFQTKVQRIGKVVKFLRDHPLSTSDEVFNATGVSVMEATRWCCNLMYQGKRVWRLNTKKMRKEGLL